MLRIQFLCADLLFYDIDLSFQVSCGQFRLIFGILLFRDLFVQQTDRLGDPVIFLLQSFGSGFGIFHIAVYGVLFLCEFPFLLLDRFQVCEEEVHIETLQLFPES